MKTYDASRRTEFLNGAPIVGRAGEDRHVQHQQINGRLENLIGWLAEEEPDVVCLQELKAQQGAFPAETLEQIGYHAAWSGKRTWNGVAILSRGSGPVVTRTRLPGDPTDSQARYIEAAVDGVLIASLYAVKLTTPTCTP